MANDQSNTVFSKLHSAEPNWAKTGVDRCIGRIPKTNCYTSCQASLRGSLHAVGSGYTTILNRSVKVFDSVLFGGPRVIVNQGSGGPTGLKSALETDNHRAEFNRN